MSLALPQTPHVVVCDLPHGPQMSLLVGCAPPRHSTRRGPSAIFRRRAPDCGWEHIETANRHAAIGELVSISERFQAFEGDEREDVETLLRVRLYSRELYAVPPQDVRMGMATLMVGSELIAYRRCEQDAPSEYVLAGLWRGIRDTGDACGSHAVGEPVMLLDPALVSIPYDPGQVGETWAIKAASAGQNLADVPIAWEAKLTGASGVPMRPLVVDGHLFARSRWSSPIDWPRHLVTPSELLDRWQWDEDRVRQIGLNGPGRWARPDPAT